MALSRPKKPILLADLPALQASLEPAFSRAVQGAIGRATYIHGPEVAAFEAALAAFLGLPSWGVIACNSGTDALQASLAALDLPVGSEVIVPAHSYISTASAVAQLGLRPVFVDSEPHYFSMDPGQLRQAITPSTGAVVAVHLFGQCADMERILAVCQDHGLPVVEDNAQSLGAEVRVANHWQAAGTAGTIGTLSFYPSKHLGALGDGGAVLCGQEDLARRMRQYLQHGEAEKFLSTQVGINSRLDSPSAAALEVKLRHLEAHLASRQQVAARYDEAFAPLPRVESPQRAPWSSHTYHQYCIRVAAGRRSTLQQHLAAAGVPTQVYYPTPLHLQPCFGHLGHQHGDLPQSEIDAATSLALPIHPFLESDQQAYIIEQVALFFGK